MKKMNENRKFSAAFCLFDYVKFKYEQDKIF
jgi:hypothetical protein